MKPQIAQITPISRIDLWELKEDGTRLRAVRAWEGGSEERGDAEEKRMRTAIGVVTAVAALLVMALWYPRGGPNDGRYAAEIRALESADVATEVGKAVATGDRRFVGLFGDGLYFPGVPDARVIEIQNRQQYRVLPDTTDCFESKEHERLQRASERYAEKYNRALLAKIAARAER